MNLNEYISYLDTLSRKDAELDRTSLDILAQFAAEKYMSAYQIWSSFKSIRFKMAYKNVHKRTNTLLSSGSIQEPEDTNTSNKHNAKYYQLTEYGIYQLFLKRLNWLLIRQLDVIRDRELPTSNALTFFRNYNNSILFEFFLYPYFNKDTLFAIGDLLVERMYHYISSCCGSIERYLEFSKVPAQGYERIFSFNRVPGEDNELLLSHLKQVFRLESIDSYNIKKDDNVENPTTTVNISCHSPIVIKLDKARNKVLMRSRSSNDEFKVLEYDFVQLGEEMMVHRRKHIEEKIKGILHDAEKQIEQLIYEFVCDLASPVTETSEELSYYFETLSQDDKFMKVVEKIHEDRHKGFERGYKQLRNCS